MDRHKKLFLLIGVAVGLVQGIIFSIRSGLMIGITVGILSGLIVAGVVAVLMRSMNVDNAENYAYKKTLQFQFPYEECFEICRKALSSFKYAKLKLTDHSQGKLIAKLGITWTSTGEIMTFQFKKIDDENTAIDITSIPVIPSPVYNFESTEKIIDYLSQLAHSETREKP